MEAARRLRMENDLTLALLRGGVPSTEVLACKGIGDLRKCAERHGMGIEIKEPTPPQSPTSAPSEEHHVRFLSSPPTSPGQGSVAGDDSGGHASSALTRARAWRHQYVNTGALPGSPGAQLPYAGASQPGDDADVESSANAGEPSSVVYHPSDDMGRGVYDGERNENGEREGRGIYRFADGGIYEGEWKSNLQEGKGLMRYASGSVYDGDWTGGMQSGQGIFRYASGSEYDGGWVAGKKHGSATYRYADGRAEVATYKDGENDRSEGAMWSADRRVAWRIVRDGEYVEEIALNDAREIAERISQPVPPRHVRRPSH